MTTDAPTMALEAAESLESAYPPLDGANVGNRSAGIACRFEPTVAA